MKLAHRLLLPAMAFFAINAHGQTEKLPSATIDGMTYKVTSLEEHTCELYQSTDECIPFGPDIVIPATVEIEGEEYSVTSISSTWYNVMWNVSEAIKTISLPATLTELSKGGMTFYCLYYLTDIFVAEGNPALSSVDGVLFNADKTKMIKMPNKYLSTRPDLNNRYDIPESVTALDYGAVGCEGIQTISIPASLTEISNSGFGYTLTLTDFIVAEDNPALTTVDGILFNADKTTLIKMPPAYFATRPELEGRYEIPTTVNTLEEEAFYDCSGLKYIDIPESVTVIGSSCFRGCSALESIIIPDKVTSIPYNTFASCSSLKELILGKGITTIGDIPSNFYSIECHATEPPAWESYGFFAEDKILIVPLGCKEAYAAAKGWSNFAYIIEKDFSSAGKAYSATVEDFTYTITSETERTCQVSSCSASGMTDIVIPSTVEINGSTYSVTSIRQSWLSAKQRDAVQSITIPATVTDIHHTAFSSFPALTDINVAEGNPAFTSVDGILFNADKTKLIRMPINYFSTRYNLYSRYEIPSTVTELEDQAFYGCKGLYYIDIPESLTSIGLGCFGQSGLIEIDIPDNVTEMKSHPSNMQLGTFYFCLSLKRANIGNGVTTIPNGIFYRSMYLRDISFGNNVTAISSGTLFFSEILGAEVDKVSFGESIKSIAPTELLTIYSIECHATEPPVCEKDDNFGSATYRNILTVPLGCKKAYAAAKGWSNFAYIVEKDFSSAENANSAPIGTFTCTVTSEAELTCQVTSYLGRMTDIVLPGKAVIDGTRYTVTSISHSWLSKEQRERVKSITIPTTITDIHHIMFSLYPALTDIVVAEGNPAFTSVDGVLFNADKTTLIKMPINYFSTRTDLNNKYEIPSTVTKLEDQAFYGCSRLYYIDIPESLTSIGLSCFSQSSLSKIEIPDNVTELKSHPYKYFGTFCSCGNLVTVNIGNGITTIPNGIFYMTSIRNLYFGDKITAITTDMLGHNDTQFFDVNNLTLGKGTTNVASMQDVNIKRKLTCCATVPPVCEADENFSSYTYKWANLIVPYGCKEAYAAAKGWSGFANITESEVISGIDAATDGMATAADVRYENGTLTCDAWDNGTRVTVYTANGSIVLSATANDGKVEFPAVAGFYIVAANGSTSKVLVR